MKDLRSSTWNSTGHIISTLASNFDNGTDQTPGYLLQFAKFRLAMAENASRMLR